MPKERLSVTVDPDVATYLEQPHINASGLVNDLLKNHIGGGGEQLASLQLRKRQLESEIDAATGKVSLLQDELNKINSQIDGIEAATDRQRQDAAEKVKQLYPDRLEPSHPAVKTQAESVNMTPENFIEFARRYHGNE